MEFTPDDVNLSRYAVQEVRELNGTEIFCGLRKLAFNENPDTPFVIIIDSPTESALEYQSNIHLRSQNYDETTTRILGVIVGQAIPAKIALYMPESTEAKV